ncbi:MAG TPA: hypothetical protein VGW98_11585 [Solirubrobacteraceae bacterium]|jgi:hypothetical protein|nr:hypothetical protein [Solirubrobacteraceae bacterium]
MAREFATAAEERAYNLGRMDAKAEQPEPLTLEQVKGMTTEEVAERLPEVNAVLAGGGNDGE